MYLKLSLTVYRCKYSFYVKNGNAVFNYFDSKSSAGYLACQQPVDIFNEIPYYVKNEHIEAFYINEDRCQSNKLHWESKTQETFIKHNIQIQYNIWNCCFCNIKSINRHNIY